MKRLLTSVVAVAFCLILGSLGSTASAATLASDDFESPTAPAALNGANGGTGFTAPWSADAGVSIETKALVPPFGRSGSLQAALIDVTAGNVMSRPFAAFSSGPLYVGFTLRGENIDDNDFISVQVSDGASSNAADTLGVGFRNTTDNPFYARSGTSGSPGVTVNSALNLVDDTDYRIVAKFSKGLSGDYETTELFINPQTAGEPLLADAIATSTQPDITQLDFFTVRSVSITGDDNLFLDDLIIADDFATAAAVVPEPTSIALWTLLGLIGAGYGWRRRHLLLRVAEE